MIHDPLPGPHQPAPADEQARLLRLLAERRPPAAPFGDVLPPGSFNGPLAAGMRRPDQPGDPAATGKGPVYPRISAIVQGPGRKARGWE